MFVYFGNDHQVFEIILTGSLQAKWSRTTLGSGMPAGYYYFLFI